jgi:hypothetical protein
MVGSSQVKQAQQTIHNTVFLRYQFAETIQGMAASQACVQQTIIFPHI